MTTRTIPSTRVRAVFPAPGRTPRTAAFTLTEVLVAVTILGMATAMTMVVFVGALKRARHTEDMLSGTAELRYATDFMTEAIRSAPLAPTTPDGVNLYVVKKATPYLVVAEDTGTWIDSLNSVRGSKATQQNMKVQLVLSPVLDSVFSGTSRPSGALSTADVATYFKPAPDQDAANAPKVSDYLKKGDTVSIPQTAYGRAIDSLTVNSVSQNGPKNAIATITFTAKLGQDVPDGTRVSISKGNSVRFQVVQTKTRPSDLFSETQLRYYPDSDDTDHFIVLARNLSLTPLTKPEDSTKGTTLPFVVDATSKTVALNLQKIPNGTAAGRTVQGVRTTVYTRTDPTIP